MTAPALPALPEIQRLLAEATPGPWDYVPSNEHHGPYVTTAADLTYGDIADCYVMSKPSELSTLNGGPSRPIQHQGEKADANAALIAASRTALPSLIEAARERDEIRALAERLARALEGAAVAVPVLDDMQHIVGLHLGEEQARKIAAEIDAALFAARSAGLIEETEGQDG